MKRNELPMQQQSYLDCVNDTANSAVHKLRRLCGHRQRWCWGRQGLRAGWQGRQHGRHCQRLDCHPALCIAMLKISVGAPRSLTPMQARPFLWHVALQRLLPIIRSLEIMLC